MTAKVCPTWRIEPAGVRRPQEPDRSKLRDVFSASSSLRDPPTAPPFSRGPPVRPPENGPPPARAPLAETTLSRAPARKVPRWARTSRRLPDVDIAPWRWRGARRPPRGALLPRGETTWRYRAAAAGGQGARRRRGRPRGADPGLPHRPVLAHRRGSPFAQFPGRHVGHDHACSAPFLLEAARAGCPFPRGHRGAAGFPHRSQGTRRASDAVLVRARPHRWQPRTRSRPRGLRPASMDEIRALPLIEVLRANGGRGRAALNTKRLGGPSAAVKEGVRHPSSRGDSGNRGVKKPKSFHHRARRQQLGRGLVSNKLGAVPKKRRARPGLCSTDARVAAGESR